MPLSPQVVAEVKRLLAETRFPRLSFRQIAAQTGVNKGSVRAIANGDRLEGFHGTPTAGRPPDSEFHVWLTAGEEFVPRRLCPGCRKFIVVIPCRACRVRAFLLKPAPLPENAEAPALETDLALDFRDDLDAKARYEELHLRKEQEEAEHQRQLAAAALLDPNSEEADELSADWPPPIVGDDLDPP